MSAVHVGDIAVLSVFMITSTAPFPSLSIFMLQLPVRSSHVHSVYACAHHSATFCRDSTHSNSILLKNGTNSLLQADLRRFCSLFSILLLFNFHSTVKLK